MKDWKFIALQSEAVTALHRALLNRARQWEAAAQERADLERQRDKWQSTEAIYGELNRKIREHESHSQAEMNWNVDGVKRKIDDLEAKTLAILSDSFIANPQDINRDEMALLESGALATPRDFEAAAKRNANNPTMLRILFNAAEKRAKAGEFGDLELTAVPTLTVLAGRTEYDQTQVVKDIFSAARTVLHTDCKSPDDLAQVWGATLGARQRELLAAWEESKDEAFHDDEMPNAWPPEMPDFGLLEA